MTAGGPSVDIVIDSPQWDAAADVESVLRRAIAACAPPASAGELTILLTNDDCIRALNRQWRQRDEPTNVLSFPAGDRPAQAGTPRFLGDIVIAYETVAREAAAEGKPFGHHLAHLAVHGFLHLLGYDHLSDAEAEAMERLERDILARIDVPDPYELRDRQA